MDLLDRGNNSGYDTKSLRKLAYLKLEELFHTHHFHKVESDGFHNYNVHAGTPIEHPLASPDRGFRWADCTTDLSSLEPGDIANLILNVNDNATNNFIQLMRRRLSVLERPIVTAKTGRVTIIPITTRSMHRWLLPFYGCTTTFVSCIKQQDSNLKLEHLLNDSV